MAKRQVVRIEITGEQGSGKTRVARDVLLPALRASGWPFSIVDGDGSRIGSSVRVRSGGPAVDVVVLGSAPAQDALRRALRTMQGLQAKLIQMSERYGMKPGFDDLGAERRMADLAKSIEAAEAALGDR